MIPNWLAIAKKEIGQHEIRGGENPRIIEYHNCCTLHAREDEIPWCSAFVNWCMQKAGFNGTKSAAARSWLEWGKDISEIDDLPRGAIVVFCWDNGTGHVGFLWNVTDDGVEILGGNQSDSVSIATFKWTNVCGVMWPAKTQVKMVAE